ncbi:MAG: hypothetical protein H0X03_09265 [Nitrosopumilus sp.]|nr:hypothetical protein [Nitrosopumilus sp.]
MNSITKDKIKKFIVYINEFDKFDENNEPVCRNNECIKKVCKPFRKYCSKKCSKEFSKWYNSNFYWSRVRSSVFKRDDFTCQICEIKLHKRKRYNKLKQNWLECDHIVPKVYYYDFGYRFDTLENKIKTIIEFFHNKDNLRTLCYNCHKQVTLNNKRQKRLMIKSED